MVDLLLICALCDQEMFITRLLCTQPLFRNHTHLVCIEHDTNIANRHITCEYANLEVKVVHVVMAIKYDVMLLCF
jgi:hypothetical protein